jgi:hypothetical protein
MDLHFYNVMLQIIRENKLFQCRWIKTYPIVEFAYGRRLCLPLLPDINEDPVLCRTMSMRAVKTIEKDEEILASYYDANVSVQSAAERFFFI